MIDTNNNGDDENDDYTTNNDNIKTSIASSNLTTDSIYKSHKHKQICNNPRYFGNSLQYIKQY